ncbi:MAG: alpha/beta hydrolase [Deltaproteobacteria bacterium]|nr:alpha/beta hydrolase [Deltaproteobacteria bacterium]
MHNHYQKVNNQKRFRTIVRSFKLKATSATTRWSWSISPSLTKRLVQRSFFKPVPFVLPKERLSLLDDARYFTLTIKSGKKRIAFWHWGNGPAILLIHGWGGQGIQFYNLIQRLRQEGFSVITFDKPAHGFSSGKTTNVFEFIETTQAVFQHELKIKGILAHSMGAVSALWITQNNPLPLVLIAPIFNLTKGLVQWSSQFGIEEKIILNTLRNLEKKHSLSLDEISPDQVAAKCNSPTMVIHDKFDKVTSASDSKKLAELLTNGQLLITEDLGHNRILEDTQVISHSLVFFNRYSLNAPVSPLVYE